MAEPIRLPPLQPPVGQVLGRLQAAQDLLAQATSPMPMAAPRRLYWVQKAAAEVAAAQDILRQTASYPIL